MLDHCVSVYRHRWNLSVLIVRLLATISVMYNDGNEPDVATNFSGLSAVKTIG